MGNPVVRWQIIASDPDATADFYRQLFGWSMTQDNPLGYRQLKSGAGGCDGGVWPGPADHRPFVQFFVAVPNVDEYIAKAVGMGAKVLVPATILAEGDTAAVLLDPSGMSFGVCTRPL